MVKKLTLIIGASVLSVVAVCAVVIPVSIIFTREKDVTTTINPTTTTATTNNPTTTIASTNNPITQTTRLPFNLASLKENEKDRINCFLEEESRYENLTKYQCETVRSCIYAPSVFDRVPACYYDRSKLGYKLVNAKGNSYELKKSSLIKAPYLGVIESLKMNVNYLGSNIIRVKISDKDKERYEIPYELNLPSEVSDLASTLAEFTISDMSAELSSFKIVRKSNKQVLFDTEAGAFVFNDQFIQISTNLLNNASVYGFGENNHESLRHDLNYKSWGMFARDNAPGWGDNRNNYGFQPVYLIIEPSGKSHLVLLYNSNAMEHLFTPKPSLTLRTIGGILDFFFVVGESPEEVLQHYHNLIGLPMFPPYWSFGFQISRWGYKNLQEVKDLVERTKKAGIYHDVQYIDIDYMIGYRILTIDPINFNGTGDYKKQLENEGMRLILIVDPALVMENNNTAYVNGIKDDIYVKWPKYMTPYDIESRENDDMISWCWPNGKLSYPDYLNTKTHEWWKKTVKDFIESKTGSDIDGIWIDMNEPSSFETNELKPWNWLYPEDDQDKYPYFSLKCPTSKYDDPPWDLLASNKKARLSQKTLCMIAEHHFKMSDQTTKTFLHYEVHNLYAHAQAIASYNAMLHAKPELRPFVLTRSNFVGTGKYSTHWLGDNDSTWKHMKMSIIGLIEYNIFGIPYIGADICGFFIDVQDVEMCTRWLQLGAFYTFSRNHNANKNIEKDPASFKNKTLEESTRNVLKIRYEILPYIYTLFFDVNQKGGSVIRPLFFEFPTDQITLDIDEQFLLGSSFLISPVLNPGQRSVRAYFPNDKWYDYRTGKLQAVNGWVDLQAPLEYINLHVRGGSILPIQDPLDCLNTVCSRTKPLGLVVSLDLFNKSEGSLFWDDGVSHLNMANPNYYHVKFDFQNNQLKMDAKTKPTTKSVQSPYLKTIRINGLAGIPSTILVNSNVHSKFDYDSINSVLKIQELDEITLDSDLTVQIK